MANVPPNAEISPDGNYFWDGTQWQPVQGSAADSAAASGSSSGSDAGGGFSLDPNNMNAADEQQMYGQGDLAMEDESTDSVEVLAMADSSSGDATA